MHDWKAILGEHNSEAKRNQASLALFEMTNAGVGEALAIQVVKQVYAKDIIVKGERDKLVQEAIAGVSAKQAAVVAPDEVRCQDSTLQSGDLVDPLVIPEKKFIVE